jgi:hypothetical protein
MTYRLEILTHIPEDELEEYKKFVDMLVKTPISKLSKDDLDKMMKYYMSKKEMIEIAMKKTGDNEGEYEYDMNLLYAIINSIYAEVRNNDYNRRLLKFSDGETMIEYYKNIKHFTEYKKYIDERTKPESSPYVDNEKPNPNIGNANTTNTNIGNANSNLRESYLTINNIPIQNNKNVCYYRISYNDEQFNILLETIHTKTAHQHMSILNDLFILGVYSISKFKNWLIYINKLINHMCTYDKTELYDYYLFSSINQTVNNISGHSHGSLSLLLHVF